MKRFTQFAAIAFLAAGLAVVCSGCEGDGQKTEGATTMPDHPQGEHPQGEHPTGEHPSGEHPK